VKRLSKAILFALGGLLSLGLVTLIALNLYLQSPGTQAQIQEAIGDALGLPIEITNTSLTPWSDLKINGIRVPALDGGSGNFLEAQDFTAHYQVLPLLSRKLIVPHMTLNGPKLTWRQDAEGRWVWPRTTKKREGAVPETKPTEEKPKVRKPKRIEGESRSGFQVVIEGLDLQGGAVELLDAKGQPVVAARDVSVDFTRLQPNDLGGTLRIAGIVWASTITVEQLTAPFTFTDGTLDLPELAAQLAEGELRGSFRLETETPASEMEMKLSLSKVSLGPLSTSAGWAESGALSGRLSGNVEMHGSSKEFTRGEGKGHLELVEGHFQQLELFQAIGQVLAIDELANLHLSEASADFRIADEKAFIDPIVLGTPDLRITAKGIARFDNKLSLDAQLAITEKLARRLQDSVRKNFAEAGPDGWRPMPFKIGGKVLKPKTDIAEKLVGNIVGGQVQDLISGLFGGKKKKPDEKDAERKTNDKKKSAEKASPPPVPQRAAEPSTPGPTPIPTIPPTPEATPEPQP
jgi:uncharacterized protein involved in outer membrane biogenesis